jgi:excisionase family DNA binding protein
MPNDQPDLLLNDSEVVVRFGRTTNSEYAVNPAVPANVLQPKLQYSREGAAGLLSISLRTLDRLIAGKNLPVRRVGRRVLITRDALEKFVKKDHET